MFNSIIIATVITAMISIALILVSNLIGVGKDAWYDAICLMETYDTFISTDMLDYDQDNLRWNRFLGIKGCLTKLPDHASSEAAFHNEKLAA